MSQTCPCGEDLEDTTRLSANRTLVRGTMSEAERCVNTARPLTRSTSTGPKEGLAMKATFWAKVCIRGADECWMWEGTVLTTGYGQFKINGIRWAAHRFAYVDAVGPIPDGLTIDHLCYVPLCVNPRHMEPVTGPENTRRARRRARLRAKERER